MTIKIDPWVTNPTSENIYNNFSLSKFNHAVKTVALEYQRIFDQAFFLNENNEWELNDFTFIEDLRELCSVFFTAWKNSSHLIFDLLSENEIFQILERFSTFREFIWPFDNYADYVDLPEELVIYRGGANIEEELIKGFSWSLDVRFAQEFAKQHHDGKVIKASVNKYDLVYYDTNQLEVVPIKHSLKKLDKI